MRLIRKIVSLTPIAEENGHPHKMMMFMAVIGFSLIFLFLVISFLLLNNPNEALLSNKFPKTLVLSSLILALSTPIVSTLHKNFEQSNLTQIKRALGLLFSISVVFGVLQLKAWRQLMENEIFLQGEAGGSFLYILSGLHLLHLVGGMIFLLFLLFEVNKSLTDPVLNLIYTTEPYTKVKLDMLTIYWYFLEFIWLALFVIFFFSLQ